MRAPMYVLNVFIRVPINNTSLPRPLKRAVPKYGRYLPPVLQDAAQTASFGAAREGASVPGWGGGTRWWDVMPGAPELCLEHREQQEVNAPVLAGEAVCCHRS